MEIMSASIPEKFSEGGWIRDSSICFSFVQSSPSSLLIEARTKQFGLRCIATKLVPQRPLRFFLIFTDTQGTEECRVEEYPFFDTDDTNLAEPDRVPKVNLFVNKKFAILTTTSKSLKEFSGENAPSSSKSNNEVSCLHYYRQYWVKKGISERASNLILSSRREGTNQNYCSSWNKWASWCDKQKVVPFRFTLKWVLDFLAELSEQG